jgi:hypothetical protein
MNIRWIVAGGCIAFMCLLESTASAWQLQYAPIMTPWAQLVDTNNPLPEYPRPQLVRSNWLNLNGIWQFQPGATNDPVPTNQTLSGDILVPYPMESALSGVAVYHAFSWYRRTFVIPPGWSGQHVLLHLDAVDWRSQVYINGQSAGAHTGGYDPITYDITPYLNGGTNELIVQVYSPEDNGGQPRGKQTLFPGGIMHTSSSGIWQPAWLEPVPVTSVGSLLMIPDIDNNRVKITVNVSGPTNGVTVYATVFDGSNVVSVLGGAGTQPGQQFLMAVPGPKLWSPTNPFLYNLSISLQQGGSSVDSVGSYFGMRKISLATNNNQITIQLNNQFVFEFGPLDQGFWPDGVYTAPTDAALKSDIEQEKLLGFNMVRKHIKVERQRWYYYADTLGILVWQDMPSCNSYTGNPSPPAVDPVDYENELSALVTNHWNSPAIVMWTLFNENQGEAGSGNGVGQASTASLVQLVRGLDTSRLINQASGGAYFGVGDIFDNHSYPSPGNPTSTTQAVVDGEFGGVALLITNHVWTSGGGEGSATDTNNLASQFEGFCGSLSSDVQSSGLSGAIYTQTTDVEDELNGLLTYDRKVRKPDPLRIRAAIASVGVPQIQSVIVPTAQTNPVTWLYVTNYTTNSIPANWYATNFSDSSWSSGQAGFGTPDPGVTPRTTWNNADIWLRRRFNPGALTAQQISNLNFYVYHDEDVQIYINGVFAGGAPGYSTSYVLLPMTPAGQSAMLSNATNLIAVHVHQTVGGQFIDVGIVTHTNLVLPPPPLPGIPTNVVIAAGPLGVSLGWDSSSNAMAYNVKRSVVSGGPYTNLVPSAPLNCWLDSAVTNGTTYYYVISAINASGESANSIQVSVTIPAAAVSPPPVLTTWFKADALALANGAAVSTWPDSSGNGDNATQANSSQMPTFVTGAMNGLPVVRFTSASQTYLGFPRPVAGDFTIICVFQSTQGLNSGTLYYQGAGLVNGEVAGVVNDFGTCLFANGSISAGTGNPDVAVDSGTGYNDGHPHIMTFTRLRSAGLVALYVDGVLAGTTSGGLQNLTAPAQLVLGAQQTLLNFLSGDIAEVKIYNAVLSTGDRVADESSLQCKYGLGAGSPPGPPTNLTAIAGNRQVQLTWNTRIGAASYNVFWSSNSAGTFALRTNGLTSTNFIDFNALNGRTNYYQVAAVNTCGVGANSATVSVFLPLPTLGISRGQNSLDVSWPAWASDWILYSATNLTPPVVWSQVTSAVTNTNGQLNVTLPINSGVRFFRLSSP